MKLSSNAWKCYHDLAKSSPPRSRAEELKLQEQAKGDALKAEELLRARMQLVADHWIGRLEALVQAVAHDLPGTVREQWLSSRRRASAWPKMPRSQIYTVEQHRALSEHLQIINAGLSYAALGHQNGTGTWIWNKHSTTGKALWKACDKHRQYKHRLDVLWFHEHPDAAESWDYYSAPDELRDRVAVMNLDP